MITEKYTDEITEKHTGTGDLLQVSRMSVFAERDGARRTLVRDVSLGVGAGDTLGIVGESGSGKSMLMKAVMGLLPRGTCSEGEVTFDGTRIDGWTDRQFRSIRGTRISLLLQDPFTMLNPVQSVGATIAESLNLAGRQSRQSIRAEVSRRLSEVGIAPAVASKRPFQLSGGMRQRVAIAASLASDPDLLVADEPTTALDAATQHDVIELLSSLQRGRNMALILITHDLRVAFDTCDRVMVMYAGSAIEEAPATELRTNARHPYTLGLMLAEPPVDRYVSRLNAIDGSVPRPDDVIDRCAFAPRCEFVADICLAERPTPRVITKGHLSRCARIDSISDSLGESSTLLSRRDVRPTPILGSTLLEVADLRKTYHTASLLGPSTSYVALNGVSFAVSEGETVGLVGESGSGKTTIARSILGLASPDSGRITLDGYDISNYRDLSRNDNKQVRKLVQVVFQDPYSSLNRSLTIGSTLREAIVMRGDSYDIDNEIEEALKRVSLPVTYASKLPAALSGGERQRISIARALCMRPKLLICDEPVAALDVSVQAQVLELLRSVQQELGMAMLFITHDLAVVRQMTERVLVLNNGNVVESGVTDDLLDSPRHPYTKSLLAAIPGHA